MLLRDRVPTLILPTNRLSRGPAGIVIRSQTNYVISNGFFKLLQCTLRRNKSETDLLFSVVKKQKDRPLRWSKSDDTFVEHYCQTAAPCSDSSGALLHSPSRWCCRRHRELQPVNLHMSDKAVQNHQIGLVSVFRNWVTETLEKIVFFFLKKSKDKNRHPRRVTAFVRKKTFVTA